MVYAGLLLVVLPLLLSKTYPTYTWGPGRVAWNITGIGTLAAGFGLVASAVRENIARLGGWRRLGSIQQSPMETGSHRYSRNPLYLAAGLIWLGWAMLFGSVFLLSGLFVVLGGVSFLGIPYEERQWEVALGDAYLHYKEEVARRLGREKKA